LHAVSVPQPDASALLTGPGPAEYPAWRTGYRGLLLIHAAKAEGGGSAAVGLVCNALIGVVDLVDCLQDDRRDDRRGDEAGYRWVLANPRVFAAPVPHNGKVGMFDISNALVADALASATPPGEKGKKN
jgi:hypothetical protein